MSSYQELVSILKEILTNRFYPKPEFIKGLLGDGQGNVLVPGRPDFNYVRFNRSANETFEVFNKEVNQPVDGTPVLIGEYPWQPGLIQVVGIDWEAYIQTGWGDRYANLQSHAPTHEWPDFSPGSDFLSVYLRNIYPLRGFGGGTGSMSFAAHPYQYDYTGTNHYWSGNPSLNLAPTRPPTGTMRYMGVYLNPATNTLGAVTGASVAFVADGEPSYPAWPLNVYPVAFARVYGGQAYFIEQDIKDARRLWNTTLTFTGTASGGSGDVAAVRAVKNRLYHSLSHNIWEATSFTHIADAAKFAAYWYILHNASSGFEPNIIQSTVASGDTATVWPRLTGQEAAKLAGFIGFIKATDTYPLRGKTLSVSFEASGSGVTTLRAAVLSWGSTADAYTVDVVGTWGTGNPTLATNWSYANTPAADISITADLTTYTIDGISFPVGGNNLAVFIWTPATFNSGSYVDIRNVQVEIADTASDFVARPYILEAALCDKSSSVLKISELWESDGGAVALSADASGNLTASQNVTQAASKEIYVGGDSWGLKGREIYGLGSTTPVVDDFDGAALNAAWVAAGAPFNGTLPSIGSSWISWTFGSAPGRAFMYRTGADPTAYQTGMFLLYNNNVGSYVGLRMDDGSDNNYVEAVLRYNAANQYSWSTIYCTGGGGVTSTAQKLIEYPMPVRLMLRRSGANWSNWGGFSEFAIKSWFGYPTGFGSGWTWTPTRCGIVAYHNTGGATWQAYYADWWNG